MSIQKNDERFDALLDMSDPDFVEKLRKALGVMPGDTVEIVTPQFERTDGVIPAAVADSWEKLRNLTKPALQSLGCGVWDEPDANGAVLMLFPKEWYGSIPNGYLVEGIGGKTERFERGKTDDDYRFGCLAFGVRVPASAALEARDE